MRFKILETVYFGPYLEATVEFAPGWFQKLLGKRQYTNKYFSTFGLIWYELPYFDELSMTSELGIALSRSFNDQVSEYNKKLAIAAYQQEIANKDVKVKRLD